MVFFCLGGGNPAFYSISFVEKDGTILRHDVIEISGKVVYVFDVLSYLWTHTDTHARTKHAHKTPCRLLNIDINNMTTERENYSPSPKWWELQRFPQSAPWNNVISKAASDKEEGDLSGVNEGRNTSNGFPG